MYSVINISKYCRPSLLIECVALIQFIKQLSVKISFNIWKFDLIISFILNKFKKNYYLIKTKNYKSYSE